MNRDYLTLPDLLGIHAELVEAFGGLDAIYDLRDMEAAVFWSSAPFSVDRTAIQSPKTDALPTGWLTPLPRNSFLAGWLALAGRPGPLQSAPAGFAYTISNDAISMTKRYLTSDFSSRR